MLARDVRQFGRFAPSYGRAINVIVLLRYCVIALLRYCVITFLQNIILFANNKLFCLILTNGIRVEFQSCYPEVNCGNM